MEGCVEGDTVDVWGGIWRKEMHRDVTEAMEVWST